MGVLVAFSTIVATATFTTTIAMPPSCLLLICSPSMPWNHYHRHYHFCEPCHTHHYHYNKYCVLCVSLLLLLLATITTLCLKCPSTFLLIAMYTNTYSLCTTALSFQCHHHYYHHKVALATITSSSTTTAVLNLEYHSTTSLLMSPSLY